MSHPEIRREAREETRELSRRLAPWRAASGTVTHTDLAGGSYRVPDESFGAFMDLYQEWLNSGQPVHLTERPLEHSRSRFDLDIKKRLPPGVTLADVSHEDIVPDRILRAIVEEILQVHAAVLDLPENRCAAYVMRKPDPSPVPQSRDLVSSGIHVVVPDAVVSPAQLHYMRQLLIPRITPHIEMLDLHNGIDDVVDRAVFQTTQGWMMYGSSKVGQPPYNVEEVVEMRCSPDDGRVLSMEFSALPPEDIPRLPSILSMRDPSLLEAPTPSRAAVAADVSEYARIFLREETLTRDARNKVYDIPDEDGKSIPGRDTPLPPRFGETERALLADLLRCMKEAPEAARRERDAYRNWILLGMALKGVADAPETREMFLDYSSLSSKFVREKVEATWRRLKPRHLGLKHVHKYAQEDNPEAYREVLRRYESALIDRCIKGSLDDANQRPIPYEVAEVIQGLHGNKLVSTGSNGGWWYYNQMTGLWEGNGGKINPLLREAILASADSKDSMYNAFKRRAKVYADERQEAGRGLSGADRDEVERKYGAKIAICNKYAASVRDVPFMSNVQRIMQDKCYDAKLVEKLDACTHLMHFAGGKVYDFKKFALRDARPEDYLTKTTDIPFMTWEEAVRDHSDVIREIEEEFFGRIMVDRRMREYLLDLLAACLDGSIRGQAYERIWILHGPFGANGKSKLVELISATFNSSKNGYVNNCLPVTLLTEKRGAADSASPAKETLRGVRFCFANEPGEAEPQLNCGTIKELTGGDAINSRQLFGEPVQLIPQCKLFLLCNFLPEVSVTDGGTWRRMCVVPFTSRFFVSDDPCSGYDPQNPEHHMSDPAIMEKFARWKVVFAAMLIERHRVLVQEKGKSIREPEPVLSESRRYQETSNRVAKFVHDWVEWIEDEEERRESPPMLLEAAFKRFSAIYGTRKSNAERTAFSRDITAQLKDQTYAGKGGGWLGYRLRDEQ